MRYSFLAFAYGLVAALILTFATYLFGYAYIFYAELRDRTREFLPQRKIP
jgi:hypothetical protein